MKIISALLGCSLFLACQSAETEQKQSVLPEGQVQLTDAQLAQAKLTTGPLEQRSLTSVLQFTGRIDVPPQNMVSVSVPMGGYLVSTKLLPGMHVGKGEVIATLEDKQYIVLQQEYLLVQSKLGFLKNDYLRQQALAKTQSSSEKQAQLAAADFQAQEALLAGLSQQLRLIGISPEGLTPQNISRKVSLRSPIDGYVTKVNVNIGKYVAPTDILFELVNPADIHLNLTVFEKDIPAMRIGQVVKAFTNRQPNKKYDCEVLLIGKDISPAGSTEVHCHFDTYDNTLLPGTYMNAEMPIRTDNRWALPAHAVVRYEGQQYVFVQRTKNQFEWMAITPGLSNEDWVEIPTAQAEKLKGQTLVIQGAYTLLMALKNSSSEE